MNVSKYRLAAKPGIARSGQYVQTQFKPVIIIGKHDKVQKIKIPQPQSLQQQIIKPSLPPRNVKRRENKNTKISQHIRKTSREHQQSAYIEKIESLRNVGVGRILIMVACGPSILEAELQKLKNHPKIDIMSINKPDPRLHPTTYWVFCDESQYKRNMELFHDYPGILVNSWSVKARHPRQILLKNRSGKGFSKNLTQGFNIGRSTTYANMQTAFWMNYDKIFIFGCDMAAVENGQPLHFYGTNADVDPKVRAKRFEKEAEFYLSGAQQMTQQERLKFVFCSSYNKWPFMSHFENLDQKIAVNKILDLANLK